jgi:hypothetical protein
MEIKFDSLASLDTSRFARATPNDYPAGRYSATITGVVPQTADKSGKFCLRFQVQIAVDSFPDRPQLRLSDFVSFTGPNGFMWAGANVFCDLAAISGLDRDTAYAACKTLSAALETGNKTGIRDSFLELAAMAATFTGTRVAPNIDWTEDGQYANVRGSKVVPSYLPASNEQDPASSFTGDDCDMERQAKPRRNLKAVRR